MAVDLFLPHAKTPEILVRRPAERRLSGNMISCLPANGPQSAFAADLAPCGEVVPISPTSTVASVAFSPSLTYTISEFVKLSSRYRGRGSGSPQHAQPLPIRDTGLIFLPLAVSHR